MLDLDNLNPAQREAVQHGEGPLLVLAGPGSGKTYTITQRIFWLIYHEHIPPEQILVITFTKDAALSMQRRFFEMSMQPLSVNFGTFHSVFYHIIRETGYYSSCRILTEKDKKKMILPVLRKFYPRETIEYRADDLPGDATAFLGAISLFKNTGDEKICVDLLPKDLQNMFSSVFAEYEKTRKMQCAMDFDDMVYECKMILQQEESIRRRWQERFSHILMDEFQDINPMQYEVIRLLAGAPYNLFAVGDDDQSIYGFRGAKPDCLKRFTEDYGARELCLNINYRSSAEIIHAAEAVITGNKNRFEKHMQGSDTKRTTKEKSVVIHSFKEREEEYQYLVSCLENIDEGKSVGVLFRTNGYMQGVAVRLSKAGIPYTMKEKVQNIYEHFIVKDIMAYLKVASGGGTRALLLQIINRPSRHIGRDAVGVGEPNYKEMKEYYRKDGLNSFAFQHIQAIELLEKHMNYLKRLSPFTGVQYIRKVIGYEEYLKTKAGRDLNRRQEWEELLNWISMDASAYKTLDDWCRAQEEYGEKLKERGEENESHSEVMLMTVHGAKGLEFDKVYIPDCNERIYPHGNLPGESTCEEERRILYVAMTRAKENLELLYLTGTKERPRLPSRFINKLLKTYSSTISSNSHSSKYSSNASATFSYSSSLSI